MRNQMIYKQSHINENKQAVLEFYALKDHTINHEELQDRKSCVKNLPSFKIWPSFAVCWMQILTISLLLASNMATCKSL